MVTCPITNSTDIRLIERIATHRIVNYYDQFGVDTRDTFSGIKEVLKYQSMVSGYAFYYPFSIQGAASLYEKLEALDWYYQDQKWEHVKALELIRAGECVLEIGCGQGSFLADIKNKYGGQPVGLELNQHAVDVAQSRGLKVFNKDINSYVSENVEYFDVVCLFQVLEHIAQPVEFLRQALRGLKVGGRLIICVPNNDALINSDKENPLNLPPHHMGLWNKQSLYFLSKVLPIKVDFVQQEPLQSYHIDWYVRTLLKKIVGDRFFHNVMLKTNIPQFVKKKVHSRTSKIHGHSILGVYTK
jgi:SAM-dependent methyltransferase